MVLCKFFQQGSCRYGQSCRFEHIYASKYTYQAPENVTVQVASNTTVTDEQLMNQVQSDVQSALRGGQWLLSSYAPYKDKPALPGLQDLSFEEARLLVYEAMASNNVDQALAYMSNLFQEAKQKHETLLVPSPTILNTLRRLYNGEITSASTFQNNVQTNTNPTSLFRTAVQGTQNSTSIFSKSPDNSTAKSLFAQAASQNAFGNNQSSQNVFASSQNPQANSVFGAPVQNSVFSSAPQNAFTETNPASIFAMANQQVSDPFGQKNQQVSDPFGQKSSPFSNQQPSEIFSRANIDQIVDDGQTYSNLEDLMQQDIDAFTSDSFQFGFVPEIPTPKALCV